MGFFINIHDHDHGQSNGMVFLLGAIFNIFANTGQKNILMESLQKGNMQQVTFLKEGREEKMFVTANPRYKNLDVYNANMEKQFQGVERNDTTQRETNTKKESLKDGLDEEGSSEKSQKSAKRGGVSI